MTENANINRIRAAVREFPQAPGVYLMKDADGKVLYVGKAKNLRDRVSSYFQPSADIISSRGPRIVELLEKVIEVGFLESESEVEAILHESRLIKDIQPLYNSRQTDDKTFPYLEITMADDYPAVYVTRSPKDHRSRLYGPFTNSRDLRRVVQVIQRVFRFRTCKLEIDSHDVSRRFFRPCILHDIKQCSAPCGNRISKEAYRKDIKRFRRFLESKRSVMLRQLYKEMQQAAKDRQYETAARLRDQVRALESLDDRGEIDEHVQPEIFQVAPAEGLERLTEILELQTPARVIEGIDIAHIQGQETVGALVCFIDGRPFKTGYRRYRIRQTDGIDDYGSIREVVSRRYRHAGDQEEVYPDIILIDGGLGQLHAAQEATEHLPVQPPMIVSLAKKEELIYVRSRGKPLRLQRNDPALRLLQFVRDEAHRFAQHYFHILQKKSTLG